MASAVCDHQGAARCCPLCCVFCWVGSQERGLEEDEGVVYWSALVDAAPGARRSTIDTKVLYDWGVEAYEKNAHGVHGYYDHYRNGSSFVPVVCMACPLRDTDGDDYTTWTFCTANLWMPVRKGTCRLRERVDAMTEEEWRHYRGFST